MSKHHHHSVPAGSNAHAGTTYEVPEGQEQPKIGEKPYDPHDPTVLDGPPEAYGDDTPITEQNQTVAESIENEEDDESIHAEDEEDAVSGEGGESELLREEVHDEPGSDDELLESPAATGGGVSSVQTEAPSEPVEDPPARKRKSRRNDE